MLVVVKILLLQNVGIRVTKRVGIGVVLAQYGCRLEVIQIC